MVLPTVSKPVIAPVLAMLVERRILKPAEAKFLSSKYQIPSELASVLLAKKIVTQQDLAKTFAAALNLPFVRLEGVNIPAAVIARIPEEVAIKRNIIAYQETPTHLRLAMGEPYLLADTRTGPLHQLAKSLGKEIEITVAPKQDILSVLESYHGTKTTTAIPKIDLERMAIAPEVLNKFPEEIARKYQMVVFEAPAQKRIKVAALNPNDPKLQEIVTFLRQRNAIEIELFKASSPGLDHTLALYRKPAELKPANKPTPFKPVETIPPPIQGSEFEETDIDKLLGKRISSVQELQQEVSSGFIPRVVGAILYYAALSRASDIHLEPMEQFYRLRYRIDGELREILRLPLALHPPVVSRVKILSGMKIDEKRIPQDGRFDIEVTKHDIDIRVASLPTIFGEKLVLRLLDKSAAKLTLEQIGLQGRNLEIVKREIAKPWGIILATGPTGSGKTTTLYAILQKIATTKVNVITLEDPVEYEVAGANQSQVRPKIGFSFAEGLRSVLRQDPNVIMVGEIRDRETAELATQAALTGHLVLSTLHTNDAASSISRLINIGVEPFLITSAINAIISERLVRKLCLSCRKPISLPAPLKEQVIEITKGVPGFDIDRATFYEPSNCPSCTNGYLGRIGIFEVMAMSEKIEQAALSRQAASEIEKIARLEGMLTMRQEGILKAAIGMTSLDEVWKATTQ